MFGGEPVVDGDEDALTPRCSAETSFVFGFESAKDERAFVEEKHRSAGFGRTFVLVYTNRYRAIIVIAADDDVVPSQSQRGAPR